MDDDFYSIGEAPKIYIVIFELEDTLKGEDAKTRPPETLKCSKSKTCIARKLKLHQPVYLIR